jgi:hypothetical protein
VSFPQAVRTGIFRVPAWRRWLAVTTAIGMVLQAFPAAAQDAAPPARVGEISSVSGSVSFNGAGSGGWAAAIVNYPVSAGDSLYTQPGAQAAIAVDASVLTLDENTELQVTGLSDDNLGATESQGEIFLAIRNLQPGTSFSVATPRGGVTIAQDGAYDIAAGDANMPTTVNVFEGQATVAAPGATVQVDAGQEAVLSGTDQTTAQLGQARPDDFARAQLALNQSPPPAFAPPVVGDMTGTYQLAQYGSWDQDPDYGAVWYPRVGAGWAPYREGHWADVPPWGWTWVDSAPWGFAPFHYGRWIDHGGRWGWIPADRDSGGDGYRPVYAPAVVSFFGLGLAAGLTAAAIASHSIGWVPLGPGEAFRPYYHSSNAYDRRINAFSVRDVNGIDFRNRPAFDPNHFANHRAATTIPADAMGRGENVARYGHPAAAKDFADARPEGGADFRLPQASAPLARVHPGAAPHPTAFAQRHDTPPVRDQHPGQVRPGFGANPGFHAPPVPPGGANVRPAFPGANPPYQQRQPQVFTPGQPTETFINPNRNPPQRLPNVIRPETQGGQVFAPQSPQHQQMPQVFEPQRPAAPAFHPPAGQHQTMPQFYQPQAQPPAFHPQSVQHPPAPEFRPPTMPQPHFNPPPQPAMQRPNHPQ